MIDSVEDKMRTNQQLPAKKNENKMNKRLGILGGEIKYLGKSNQKIRRTLC